MKPLIQLSLPALSIELEKDLMEYSKSFKDFKYSRNTLGEKHQRALETNDIKVLDELNHVKSLYGFDNLPQHRAKPVPEELSSRVRAELGINFPSNDNCVFLQVIDCANSFIHTDGGVRIVTLYYMLTDDATATTKFYKTNKDPLYGTIWAPSDVEETFSKKMECHNWYAFSHNTIHSVNDVSSLRVGLLIDLTRVFKTYEDCVNHFKGIVNE